MKPGRPVGSEIRERITEILAVIHKAYGYEIHKIYITIFTPCTRESIYYHLHKGLSLGEFIITEVRQEQGEFSWGGIAKKTYYSLGPEAHIHGSPEVQEWAKLKKQLLI